MDKKIEYFAVDEIQARPTNPRTHSKKQIKQLAESIRKFGFTNPILIDGEGVMLAGTVAWLPPNCWECLKSLVSGLRTLRLQRGEPM